jgi:AraC family transcriptional regulator
MSLWGWRNWRARRALRRIAFVEGSRGWWGKRGNMKVAIKRLEPMRVAFLRHHGSYLQVGGTWEKFFRLMREGGHLPGTIVMIGICYDDPAMTPAEKIRYDACLPVDGDFEPAGEIGVETIAGGLYAVTRHVGRYNELPATHGELLGRWLPLSGYEPRDAPTFEIHINTPRNAAPDELLTDVYVPLAEPSA